MKRETTTIVRRRLGDEHLDETDWARVDALSDREIEAAVADDRDAAPLLDEEFWANSDMVIPAG